MQRIDMVGRKFNRLLVVARASNASNGKPKWLCLCDCGNTTLVRGDHLRDGSIKSCGCLGTNAFGIKNLDSHSPLVATYMNMIYRCEDSKHSAFHRYGARGISVCKEWHDFKIFEDWAKAHNWQKGLEIDRINNDDGYSPNNCRIVTRKENLRNTSVNRKTFYQGQSLCIAEIAERAGLSYDTVYARYRYGWRGEDLGRPV